MNELVVILASFLLGAVVTLFLLVVWALFLYKKQQKTKGSEGPLKPNESLEKTKPLSVQERLSKVRELTSIQIKLSSQVEIPQKNSLDGKYKNGLSKEIKKIEEEKTEILRSILSDGYDPDVSALDEGGYKTMKLSQFLGIASPVPQHQATNIKAKKIQLSVLKGGKLSEEEMDNILNNHDHDNDKDKKDN